MRAAEPPTWLRGPVFTAAASMLGILAHAAGGGAAPDAARSLLAILVATGAVPLISGARQSLPRIGVVVLAVQAAVHIVLTPIAAGVHPMAAAVGGSAIPRAAHPMPSQAMTWAHLVAALLLAGWLHRGERALWAAVARSLLRLAGGNRPMLAPTPPPAPIPAGAPRVTRCPALPIVGLRAPPVTA